jgi:IrrE N-terminal-like domain
MYFTDPEIEQICEDELRSCGCYPTEPGAVRIDRFVEKRFGIVPRSEDMEEGLLGYTVFSPNGVAAMVISRSLEEDRRSSSQRRARTTFAHEAGHGILHAPLFALDALQPALPGAEDVDAARILCRDPAAVGSGYDGRWWEFQANRAMSNLLMPRQLVQKVIEPFLVKTGRLGLTAPDESRREEAVQRVAETFEVNPAAARIRVEAMFASKPGQLAL